MVRHLLDLDLTRWEIIVLFIIPACINIGIFLYVSFYLVKNRVNFAFSICVLLLGLWQAADGLTRMSVTHLAAYEWFRISWVFSLFTIPFAILFIYSVSANLKKISGRDIFLAQFFIPVLCLVLIVARLDSFTISESPVWYWISNPEITPVTSFIYLWSFFQAVFLLVLLWLNYSRENRGEIMNKQALLMAWGFTIPVVSGLIAKTVFPFIFGLDVVPVTTSLFTIFSIAVLVAIKKYRLLDFSPKNRWSDIVTFMNEGLLILDNENRIMFANEAFCNLLGYRFTEIENNAAGLFLDNPEEQQLFITALKDSKHHKIQSYEARLKAKSGEKTWVSMSISPYLDNHGNMIGTIVIQTNINDLKRAEARFRTLIENAGDIIAMTDIKGNVLYASPAMEKITGYTMEDLKERPVFQIMQPDEANIPELMREELMRNPGIPIPRKGCFLHKDGREVWLEGTVTNMLHVEDIAAIVSNFRDITEKRAAELRLEQNQKWFRTMVEYGNDAIAVLDEKNKIQYLSPNNEKILGYTIQELMDNNTIDDYAETHPEDKDIMRNVYAKCMEHPGETFTFEWRRKHKKGHWTWLEAHATNLIADPNVNGIVVNYRDISERKTIEEKIQRNEKRYKALVENGADAVMILTPSGQPIYVSPSVGRVLGYNDEEAMNINFFSLIHPDDLGPVTLSMKEVMRQPGNPIQGHTARMLHKNGSWRWYESTLVNMIGDPYTSGIINNFRDVTDKKLADEKLARSEKIYKTIASSITGSVIIIFDSEYRYLLVEGDMLEKFGYKKDQLLGHLAKEALSKERFDSIHDYLQRAFKGEFFTTESSRNGYDIITRYVPLQDENNVIYATLMVSIDVTMLKQTQREIAELNKGLEEKVVERTSQMEHANKELESFSYSVSHDLRAPLRAIHGYTQILQTEHADQLSEDARRMMGRVLINTKKMGQLMDELLVFSRLGKKELARHLFSMKELVNSLSIELLHAEQSRDIKIEIDDLPDTEADSSTIKQVWTNLLSNAIKYTKNKPSAMIRIGAEENEQEITYFIRDNGAGFDMEYVNKLFGVFQRLHSDEEFEGIGVGLAIVQRIIVKHGGRIWADAVTDEGATFYFTLPKTKNT